VGGLCYGPDDRYVREKPNSLLVHPARFHPEERHVVQQYRRIAATPFADRSRKTPSKPLGYKAPRVARTAAMRAAGDRTLSQWELEPKSFVWLHMGGGWNTKLLPFPTWLEIARGLVAAGITPVAGWGGQRELVEAKRLARSVPGVVVPQRKLGAPALCGVLSCAKVVVAPDTGILHLGAALGTPTVSFWGPSASWRSAPIGRRHRHVESDPPCGPCFRRECDHFTCMDRIRASDILAAIDASSSS